VLIGRLTTADPEGHEAALATMRSASGFTRPLTYSSTDRLKLPFALALIEHVAAADDLSFGFEIVAEAPRIAPRRDFPELRQAASFLTGCAYGAMHGAGHPLKQALVDALRARTSLIA
jgi:hypothetical protein